MMSGIDSVLTAIRNEVVLIIMAGNALEIPFHARLFLQLSRHSNAEMSIPNWGGMAIF